jgi:hypothetical protein
MRCPLRAVLTGLAVVVLSGGVCGCYLQPDPASYAFAVSNETGHAFRVVDEFGTGEVVRRNVIFSFSVADAEDCMRVRVETLDGERIAGEQSVCAGDLWTIRGSGDATLER